MAATAGQIETAVCRMLTVACVKAGTAYGPEYVTKLHAMVSRHLTLPFRFECFTDKPVEGINCRPIIDNLPGWWGKLGLFAPGIFEDRVLFFDLDTVILGSLDQIAAYEGPFAILQDFMFPPHYGSGVMAWMPSAKTETIWSRWNESGRPLPERGDQKCIEDVLRSVNMTPDLWHELHPQSFVSYKLDCFYRPPVSDAKVVCFHGKPKPHECKREFITRAWC